MTQIGSLSLRRRKELHSGFGKKETRETLKNPFLDEPHKQLVEVSRLIVRHVCSFLKTLGGVVISLKLNIVIIFTSSTDECREPSAVASRNNFVKSGTRVLSSCRGANPMRWSVLTRQFRNFTEKGSSGSGRLLTYYEIMR